MTIYLVRHAKAGDRASWPGDDFLRPLSRRGQIQAEALVEQFADLPHRSPALEPVHPVHGVARAARRRTPHPDRARRRDHRGREPRRCVDPRAEAFASRRGDVQPRRRHPDVARALRGPWCRPRHGSRVPEGMHVGPRDRRHAGCRRARRTSRHRPSRPEELRRAHAVQPATSEGQIRQCSRRSCSSSRRRSRRPTAVDSVVDRAERRLVLRPLDVVRAGASPTLDGNDTTCRSTDDRGWRPNERVPRSARVRHRRNARDPSHAQRPGWRRRERTFTVPRR